MHATPVVLLLSCLVNGLTDDMPSDRSHSPAQGALNATHVVLLPSCCVNGLTDDIRANGRTVQHQRCNACHTCGLTAVMPRERSYMPHELPRISAPEMHCMAHMWS